MDQKRRAVLLSVLLGLALSLAIVSLPHVKPAYPDSARTEVEAGAFRQIDEYWALRRGELNETVLAAARSSASQLPAARQLPAVARRGMASANGANVTPAMLTVSQSGRQPPGGAWQLLGPAPIDVGGGRYYAGRVSALAVDPTTSGSSTTLYLGAANGGVWKSTNNGGTWAPLTDQQNNLATGTITIDPSNHQVLYVGTGEPNQSGDSYYGSGVLRSTNGGASWTQLGLSTFGSRSSTVSKIVVNPYNSAQLFVASSIGLYTSANSGQSWSQVGGGLPTGSYKADALDIDASANPIRLYATLRGYGLYRSTDGGSTWSPLTSSLPPASQWFRSALAVAPSNPNVIYVVIIDSASSGNVRTPSYNGGYFSIDGGNSWSALSGLNINFTDGGFGAQGWYNLYLAVDPKDYNVVYGGGVDVAITMGGTTGAAWNNITNVYGFDNSGIHPDQHAIAFGNCSVSLCGAYLGNDGGVYFSGNTTASGFNVSYTNLNTAGLAITEFTGGDVSGNFAQQRLAVGGTQDNGTMLYNLLSGTVWNGVYGGDGGFTQIDWTQPSTIYSTNYDISPVKSTDGGASWNGIGSGLGGYSLFYMPYQMDRSATRHLVAGTTAVFETLNGGTQWYQSSQVLCKRGFSSCSLYDTSQAAYVSAVTVAPTDSRIIYAGTSSGQVFRTTVGDSGAQSTYTELNDGLFANKFINQLSVDAFNPNIVYAAVGKFYRASGSGYVYRSIDGGSTWADISGALPVVPVNTVVTYYSGTSRVVVIGTDIGVFYTTNEGSSWIALNAGLPNTAIVQLALDATRSALVAYTHGRSAWVINIPQTASGSGDRVGIYRPANHTFYLRNSLNSGPADLVVPILYGLSSDQPLVGDWNGDGVDTVGLYRNSLFLLWDTNSGQPNPDYTLLFGNAGDVPMAGDWTGRGRSGIGLFRPSNGTVYLKNNLTPGTPDLLMVLGSPGDAPVSGDWDGDGVDSIGVYRPSGGTFYLANQSCYQCIPLAAYAITFGQPNWLAFAGDWTNSGHSGVGAFNPASGLAYLKNDPTSSGNANYALVYGVAGDMPVAGRWAAGANPPPLLVPGSASAPPAPTAASPTPRSAATPAPGREGRFD